MTPLERAARNIVREEYYRVGHQPSKSVEAYVEAQWHERLDDARAVLTAIREPSEAMAQFGREVGEEAVYCDDAGKARLSVDGPREIWTEMIDALLADAR